MGLIQAAVGAVSSTLKDQWKEYFYCEAMPSDVLMMKGQKKVGGSNKGTDNIITNGSGIAVADGQCMLIVDQGQIVEVCAEPGLYTYDTSSEPSIFSGSLGDAIKTTFDVIGKRITYGGVAPKDQRVYYINTKELMDNKFGTNNPIYFDVVDPNIGLNLSTSLKCNGIYTYRIADPLKFYTEVCGNVSNTFDREDIETTLKAEFVSALQPALGKLSTLNLKPSQIPLHVEELTDAVNEALNKKWEPRGLKVVSIAMNPVSMPAEDEKAIKDAQLRAVNRDPGMAYATMVGAQAEAAVAAANNPNGAMNGFFGVNMANNMFNNMGGMVASQQQQPANTWTCSCGTVNNGNFCSNCGKPKQ